MIEHTLSLPRSQRRNIEIGYSGDRNRCPFCGGRDFHPGKICHRCGVANPTEATYNRPTVTKRKKPPTKPAVDRIEYEPQHNPDAWPEIDHSNTSIPWD